MRVSSRSFSLRREGMFTSKTPRRRRLRHRRKLLPSSGNFRV